MASTEDIAPEEPSAQDSTSRGANPIENIRFVLVGPSTAGNVGAAARALKNVGFRRLVVVAPECDPFGEEARWMAVDATDLLDDAEVVFDLDQALAGARTVVGTSRRTGRQRKPHWRLDEVAPRLWELASAGELAFVFGREKWGLTDTEIDRCTHLVHFLASEEYPSFNLAQSVMLAAYEMRREWARSVAGATPIAAPASHSEREAMYAHLSEALHAVGFLQKDTAEGMMRRIRRMLGRASLTPGDVKILRGIARQVLWKSRKGVKS